MERNCFYLPRAGAFFYFRTKRDSRVRSWCRRLCYTRYNWCCVPLANPAGRCEETSQSEEAFWCSVENSQSRFVLELDDWGSHSKYERSHPQVSDYPFGYHERDYHSCRVIDVYPDLSNLHFRVTLRWGFPMLIYKDSVLPRYDEGMAFLGHQSTGLPVSFMVETIDYPLPVVEVQGLGAL